jgi:hypothetical protein
MVSILAPAGNVLSRTLPVSRFLIFVRTNAAPLPGFNVKEFYDLVRLTIEVDTHAVFNI